MAAPAAPVTTAGVTADELPAVPADDPAVGVAAAADAADDEDDVVDDDASDVAPGTLSGAFGWPPSSGDGAILESVWRREIISGRQRRPPTCTGAPGTVPLPFEICFFCCCYCCYISLYIRNIYYISPLATSTCYFTATSCFCCYYFYVRECFLVDSEVSSSCAAAALLHKTADSTFSLTPFFLPFSLSLLLLVFVCSKPLARLTHKNKMMMVSHSHSRAAHTTRGWLLLVLCFLLVAPTDCCCWSSSRFFFFCESAGTF